MTSDSQSPAQEKRRKPAASISGRIRAIANPSALDDRTIEVVAADREETAHDTLRIARSRDALGGSFYSSLIAALVGLDRSEEEAERLWNQVLAHKYELSQKLGRNCGVRVAAMDYFSNITGDLESVRVIDSATLLKTARLAVSDGLTGLYNHRYFQDRLRQEIEAASEQDHLLSIILFDIDFFKDYNDINGHVAGDVALHQVAQILQKAVGEVGLCARYGGEEFAVILPELSKRQAGQVAESIRQEIETARFPNEFVLPGGRLTVSVGLAEFPLDGTHLRTLVDYADRTMYESKRAGKNRVTLLAPNRRRLYRQACAIPVTLKVDPAEGAGSVSEVTAQTVNLSCGGALVETEAALEQGQAVEVQFTQELKASSSHPLLAVVTRRSRSGVSAWRYGLRFVRLNEVCKRALQGLVGNGDVGA